MSERHGEEPEDEYDNPAAFTVGEYEFNPDNSEVTRYTAQPSADHFWLHNKGRIFRPQLINFQNLVEYADESEFEINWQFFPDEGVLDLYRQRFGEPTAPPLRELSPRQETEIAFSRYLMEHMVTVEDLF